MTLQQQNLYQPSKCEILQLSQSLRNSVTHYTLQNMCCEAHSFPEETPHLRCSCFCDTSKFHAQEATAPSEACEFVGIDFWDVKVLGYLFGFFPRT
jgi:hypothetical protein